MTSQVTMASLWLPHTFEPFRLHLASFAAEVVLVEALPRRLPVELVCNLRPKGFLPGRSVSWARLGPG